MNVWNRDDTFLARWLNNELSKEELQAFEQSEDFEHYLRIRDTLDGAQPLVFDTEQELAAMRERQKPETPVRKLTFSTRWLAAASVILVAGLFLVYQIQSRGNEPITTRADIAAKSNLSLPDGSSVKLNSGSTVSYRDKEWSSNRTCELRGEAFFEVTKGERFTVETETGAIEVLGTSFNIRERNKVLEVTCYTGSVRVSAGANETVLKPNEGVTLNKGEMETFVVKGTQPTWLEGLIDLNSVPLSEALEELGRTFGYEVDYSGMANDPVFDGAFPSTEVELAIELVVEPFPNLKYEIDKQAKKITVSSR